MTRIEQAIKVLEGVSIVDAASDAELLLRAAVVLRRIVGQTKPTIDYTKIAHPEVLAFLREGRKINAIKFQRELTTMGLADAKNFVELNSDCQKAASEYR